ncbi:MAG: hypothetical protein V8Q89_07275 [Christensenellales bacterium]
MRSVPEPLIIYLGIPMKNLRQESVLIDMGSLIRQIKSLGDQSRLEMLCSIKNKPTYGQELSNKINPHTGRNFQTNFPYRQRLCTLLFDCDIKDVSMNL